MKFKCGCDISPDNIDIYNLPDCGETWSMLSSGNTKGVFQIESRLGKDWIKKLQPNSIELLSSLIAIIRPGVLNATDENGESMAKVFCNRRHGDEYEIDDSIKDVLDPTFNVLVYQEQILQVAQILCGFDLKDADSLRKCITKDTMFVSKTRGWISIENLLKDGYKDDLFLIMDKYGVQKWKKIKDIWSNGYKATQKVKTRTGFKINLTKNHQIMTSEGWKARQRLKTDDYLYCVNQVEWEGQDKISKDLAIIIAGMLTEGYFSPNQSHFTNYEPDIMKIFSDAYFNCFGKVNNNVDTRVFGIRKEEREYIAKYIKYGKSATKVIPDIMMGMTLETTRKFLSFMIGCEGGFIEQNNSLEYSSKSEKMIDQIKLLLLRFGIRANKGYRINPTYGKFFYLSIIDRDEILKLNNELSINLGSVKQNILNRFVQQNLSKNGDFNIDIIPPDIVKKLLNQYPSLGSYEGGSIYKSNITRKKIERLIDKTTNKKWKKFIKGKYFYDKLENIILHSRSTEVFDFSMEDEDEPYIIANGFVIHNSIGKKIQSLIAKTRSKFIKGAIEQGLISEEKANTLYDNIEKAGRYAFNKCLCPNTLCQTQGRGMQKLKDLKVGEYITSPYGWVKVINKFENGPKSLYRWTLNNGYYIDCTVDHELDVDYSYNNQYDYMSNSSYPEKSQACFDAKRVLKTTNGSSHIIDVTYLGEKDTMDIEVDHPNHIFYGNGIGTSNSHSVAYAKLGYICAWLKYHFPLQFYCGWLTHVNDKMDPQEEMRELVQDARMNGVNINPPNLEDKKIDTYIKSGEVFLGLNNIKGLGEKSVQSIISKHQPGMSWVQTLRTYTAKQLENLIQAGALGGNRVRKLAELHTWANLTKTEQAFLHDYEGNSLLQVLEPLAKTKKEGGICSNQARADLVESLVWSLKKPPRPLVDTPVVIAKFETDMLGVQLTCTKSEGIDQRLVNTTVKDILDGKKNGMLAAEIEYVKIIKVKNGVNKGKNMAFAQVYDITGAIEAVIFPDQFELFSPYLIKGNTVIVKFYSKDLKSIIINDMWQV